jgi:hypothetical protein
MENIYWRIVGDALVWFFAPTCQTKLQLRMLCSSNFSSKNIWHVGSTIHTRFLVKFLACHDFKHLISLNCTKVGKVTNQTTNFKRKFSMSWTKFSKALWSLYLFSIPNRNRHRKTLLCMFPTSTSKLHAQTALDPDPRVLWLQRAPPCLLPPAS